MKNQKKGNFLICFNLKQMVIFINDAEIEIKRGRR